MLQQNGVLLVFFVVKGDGKSVRLVTDYTKLNSYVDRPVHPFPSVIDILQSIPSEAKYFAMFDAVNGYFQIPLDQESSTNHIHSSFGEIPLSENSPRIECIV